ncbi:hypothetical protein JCM3774_000771 [Rhodotorula dairenensis]
MYAYPRQFSYAHDTPLPDPPLQSVRELARERRAAKLEAAAAEVVGSLSPLLFDRHWNPWPGPSGVAEAPDRLSLSPSSMSRLRSSDGPDRWASFAAARVRDDLEQTAVAAASPRFQTPSRHLPTADFVVPAGGLVAAEAEICPSTGSSCLPDLALPPLPNRFSLEHAFGDDVPDERADFTLNRTYPTSRSNAERMEGASSAEASDQLVPPAQPGDLPFTIYEDSDGQSP